VYVNSMLDALQDVGGGSGALFGETRCEVQLGKPWREAHAGDAVNVVSGCEGREWGRRRSG